MQKDGENCAQLNNIITIVVIVIITITISLIVIVIAIITITLIIWISPPDVQSGRSIPVPGCPDPFFRARRPIFQSIEY